MKGLLYLFILPVLIWSGGMAQDVSVSDDYVVQAWDTDSGLPHSTVTSVVQTPDGYIWIGTLLGGLARFDGSRFVTFHPGNTPELKSIEIFKLLVDDRGTLWIGGVDGSAVSCRQGKFRFEFVNPQPVASWLNGVVSSQDGHTVLSSVSGWLFRGARANGTNAWETFQTPGDFSANPCEDRAGIIWYRTGNGGLAQVKGTQATRLNEVELHIPRVNVLLKDGAGQIWIGTDKGIAAWDGQKFLDMNPTNGGPDFAVHDLASCPDGSLWVRTDNKFRKCANRRWLAEGAPWDGPIPPSTHPLQIYGDSRGGVWAAHYGQGFWHIDAGGQVSRIGEQQGLPNGFVESWCEDREGNFWVGLRDGGLACIRPRTFHLVWPPTGSKSDSTRSICEDADGAMWFGVAGPTILRWFNGALTGLTPPAETFPGAETAVLPDGPGRLWVGTARNGLWLLDHGQFSRPFPSADIGTVVRCLSLDHTGALWLGSEYGLSRWDKRVLKRFTPADGFAPAYVLSIAEDKKGGVWFGTADGELRRWHLGKFESFRPPATASVTNDAGESVADGPMPASQSGEIYGRERFWALHFDDEGVLWIGTLGGGLLRFADGRFTRFTMREGLPNEHVSQILEDDRGQLWLGTRAGISRVDKRELTSFAKGGGGPINFITYGRSDGLPTSECSGGMQPSAWKSRDGRLWFSTTKGPVWVNPSALRLNQLPPPVQLEDVLVDGASIARSRISPAGPGTDPPRQIRISPGRHYFEFRFAALSFTSPDKVKFQWRLKGLETGWVEGGNRRSVSYSFLQAGDYEFDVRACNNDGVWNNSGVAIAFAVEPYFWQTWWFRIAVVLLLAALLLLVYSVRIARLRALENLRLRIARDLHDEVGANLGSISLLAQIMQKNPASAADAAQVRRMAVQTVDTLRDIIWFIDPKHHRLSDLVDRLQQTSQVLRQTMEVKFEAAGDFSAADLAPTFRRNVPPIFKEALHNVLKHSRATRVEISISRREKSFQFCIHDNGVGFEPSQKFAGNGLTNMKRRAEEIGGRIEIESVPGGGATVTFSAAITQTRNWW